MRVLAVIVCALAFLCDCKRSFDEKLIGTWRGGNGDARFDLTLRPNHSAEMIAQFSTNPAEGYTLIGHWSTNGDRFVVEWGGLPPDVTANGNKPQKIVSISDHNLVLADLDDAPGSKFSLERVK